MDVREQEILGTEIDQHWYYMSKGAALLAFVRELSFKTIVDVGAGSGFFSRVLLAQTAAQRAICVDPAYENEGTDFISGKPIHFQRSLSNVEAEIVLMMDVLEHVDDDGALIRDYAARVKGPAYFLITVPAFQWLFSQHDVFLQHRRRYKLEEIEAVAVESGLELVRSSYFFGFVFPLAAVRRIAGRILHSANETDTRSDLKRHAPVVNAALRSACSAELATVFPRNRIAGLTAFCLGRKC